MRKLLSFLLCLGIALCLGSSCFADVIYTPDDRFYSDNYSECETVDRFFVAPPGSVAQVSPENALSSFETEPDFKYKVSVSYTDEDGNVWGCIEKDNEFGGRSGWLPLGSMSLVYDGISFERDHGDEFRSPSGFSPDLDRGAVVYDYPASPQKWVWGSGTDFSDVSFESAWTDENGFTWLKIPYHMGIRGWICAENPLAGHDLAPNSGAEGIILDSEDPVIPGIPDHTKVITDSPVTPLPHKPSPLASGKTLKMLLTALGLTLGASAAAAVIAAVFVRKKKKR